MQLLTFLSNFAKSRQKLLIKRRKIQIKNRPVSKKYLKEERQVMNYSFESKLKQIKKSLDKKKSQNHHINQIIQQLFYPDIRPQQPSIIQNQVKQSVNNINIKPNIDPKHQQFQQILQIDQLSQQIQETLLPLDLLQLHKLNHEIFQVSHYEYLLIKLNNSVINAASIKEKLEAKWKKQISRNKDLKQKDLLMKKPNFILLESDQIIRHELWAELVIGIHNNMKKVKQNISEFNKFIKVILRISKYFKFIPASLYQLIITTNLSVPLEELFPTDVSGLMNLLRLRYHVRYQPHIKIQNPEESIAKESHLHFMRKLAAQVITNFKLYMPIDFVNIFYIIHAYQKKIFLLTEDLYNHSEYIFSSIINDLTFEEVQMYLSVYMQQKKQPNMDFVEIIKFDLFRKCQTCKKENVLLNLMGRIKGRKLIYKNNKSKFDSQRWIQIQAHELILKLAQAMTKNISKLTSFQLIKLVDIYYSNQIQQLSLLLILATEYSKKCISFDGINKQRSKFNEQTSLQSMSRSFFKITLLGYRSKMLARLVIQQYVKKYNFLEKEYRNKKVLLLPNKSEQKQAGDGINLKQIHLQQCLLMTLWSLIKHLNQNQEGIDKKTQQQLLSLIPLKIDSIDPIAIELAMNINHQLNPFNLFPSIPIPLYVPDSFPQGRHRQLYKQKFSKSPIEELMAQEAYLSGFFVENYNYKERLFLNQKWSSINTYKVQKYIQFCKEQLQNRSSSGSNYFNRNLKFTQHFLNKRKDLIEKMGVEDEAQINEKKQYKKIYEFLS